jgi:hypothetical protein
MTPKRFVQAAVLCFAVASLFFPHFEPVRTAETTALLLARPWECLLTIFCGSGLSRSGELLGKDPQAAASENGRPENGSIRRSWWSTVLDVPAELDGRTALGGRVCSPLSPRTTRLRLDMGTEPPVREGDPVVHGHSLVGFVESVCGDGSVDVLLLGSSKSRVVAAETGDGIAGAKVSFVVGGGFADLGEGTEIGSGFVEDRAAILLRFPSSRFGLIDGVMAVTSSRYNRDGIPAGFLLGRVVIAPVKPGQTRSRAGILPPLTGDRLCRLAVLVPSDRPGVEGRAAVPPLQRRSRKVRLSLPPGFLRPGAFMRVSGGRESGIRDGDLVLSGEFLVGRIKRTGLFLSTAELFLAPGTSLELVCLDSDGPESVRVTTMDRRETACRLRAKPALENLKAGSLLFLPGEPCSGAELHPVCRVADPGDGGVFRVTCGDAIEPENAVCLVPRP